MKFFKTSLLSFIGIVFICLLSTNSVAADDAGEGAGSKRIAPRPRPPGKSAKTTTTASPPEYDGDYPDGENADQYGEVGSAIASSSTTTSTEPPKKVGPVIRPFRSNDDFLNSLKRRQMDAKKNRAEKVALKHKPVERNNDNDEEVAPAPLPVAPKSLKPSLPGGNRRKFTKPGKPEPQEDTAAEGTEQQQEKEEEKPKRPSPRLALRKRA